MTAEGFESGSFIMKDKEYLALPLQKKQQKKNSLSNGQKEISWSEHDRN